MAVQDVMYTHPIKGLQVGNVEQYEHIRLRCSLEVNSQS